MKFLGKVARRLGAFFGQDTGENTIPAEYKAFLQEALRLARESGFNPSVVYPFLEHHQAKLNEDLIALIPAFSTRSNIIDLFNFANLMLQFPHGQRAINLEIAIAIYAKALDFFDCQNDATNWAMTQNSLGVAYLNRLQGERGENIEEVIRCFQAALEVRTRTAYPEDWAMTQNNLGVAYWNRLRGEREENIEEAIRCSQAALEVYTRTAYPEKWADTQICLGLAYWNRLRGEREENIEEAIRCSQAALEVYTHTAYPEKWALTQNNLGNAYRAPRKIDLLVAETLEDSYLVLNKVISVSIKWN